jgi:hypothetical protein
MGIRESLLIIEICICLAVVAALLGVAWGLGYMVFEFAAWR